MSGQLVDASIVAAPKQRNTKAEKQAIREGRCRRIGRTSRRSSARRIAMRAGPSRRPKRSPRRRDADGRPGDPRVRLPEPHQCRSPPPADPPLASHRRCRACRPVWPICSTPATPRVGLGRHRLPFQEERDLLRQHAEEPHPTKKPRRPCRIAAPGEREEVGRARPCRARLRRAEGQDGPARPDHRLGPRPPRSALPTSSTTCAACSGWNASRAR